MAFDSTFASFVELVLEHVPAMVFVKDAEHLRFVHFNRAGEQLLGLRREDLLGKSDSDFFPPDQAEFFIAKDREVLDSRKMLDIPEEPIDTPTGKRWLHTRKIPLLGPDGVPTHLVGLSIDITEQRAAVGAQRQREAGEHARTQRVLADTEEQLRLAQKMEAVGRLAGGVAHDFNNLLTVIMSHTQLALADLPEIDPLRTELSLVEGAARRAADLTRQLLAFSRRQVMRPRVLDVNEVLKGVEPLLRRLLGEDIALALELRQGVRNIKADPSQLEQVVMNLVVNARDAMPMGGKLSIETADVELDETYGAMHVGAGMGRHAMIAVTDTGCGMSDEIIERIFEPFFTTKEPGKGTGLGLATVFGIVKQSDGSIWVYSEPDKGTTFKVYFPVTNEAAQPKPTAVVPSMQGNETVLLVEDDEGVRRVATDILRRQGYRVFAARGPHEALALAEGLPDLDLLVTDVVMPEMGGRVLAETLSASRPGIRVLFMSGYTDDAIVRHGVLEAEMEFLQKPLTPETLSRRVREVLDPRARKR